MSTPAQAPPPSASAQFHQEPSGSNETTAALFTGRDFIRPGEESVYTELADSLRYDLAPVGILELSLVDEIRRAMWRLRRCGLVEETLLAPSPDAIPDPMQHESSAQTQLSVDRARSQAHRLLHKCTAELRRLQTDRQYRDETFEAGTDISTHGIADWRYIRKGLDEKFKADYHRQKFTGMAEIDAFLSAPLRKAADLGSSCKTDSAPEPMAA